jgi:hypothetical protein
MTHRIAGFLAGLTLLALGAAPALAAGPANVTVRVEGKDRTLVEQVRLATTTTPVNKSGKEGESCSGTSVAGALELATGGDWSGSYSKDFSTYFVDTVKAEKHGGDPDYWTFWVNDKAAQTGICQTELQEGDEVLFFVDYCNFDPVTFNCSNEPVRPLELRVPATAKRGDTVKATVVRYDAAGKESPVEGARIAGEGFSTTTGADGSAAIQIGVSGNLRLRADKADHARSEYETVCVADGSDGSCGTPDQAPPVARIGAIADQQRFTPATAPRELEGKVGADSSGLTSVKLRLTRKSEGKCSYFSGRQERFRPIRCGRGHYFAIGDRADWNYLLPSRLAPGRYVLDAVAIDKAGNRTPLQRGLTRVVFHVG